MSTEFFNDQWRIPSNENQNKISNYSMDFDHTNANSINVGNTLTNGFPELTVSVWVNFSSFVSNRNYGLVSKDLVGQRSFDLRYINGTGVNFIVSTNGTDVSGSSYYPVNSINIGQWYHFVGVYDGSNVLLYVDGTLTGTPTALTGSLQNTTSDFFIGKRGAAPTNTTFEGKIDQVTIFDYALSQDQVTQLGAEGYAFNFDGLDDYLETPQINLGSTNTFSFWINTTTTTQGAIFGDPNGYSNYALFSQPSLNRTAFRLGNNDSGYYQIEVSSGLLNDGNWHHHCLTRDGVTINYYLDGILQTNVTNNTLNASAGTNTTIENIFALSDGTFKYGGKLSNVALWTTELTSTQVSTLYNNGKPGDISSLNPTGWWKLDDTATFNSGTSVWTIPDDSSNSNDGTSVGMNADSLVASNINGELIANPMITSPKPIAYYQLGDQSVDNGANYLVPNNSLSDYVFNFQGNLFSGDYIDCGTGSRFNLSQTTISAWVKKTSSTVNYAVAAGIRNTNSGPVPYMINLSTAASNKIKFMISQSDGTNVLVASDAIIQDDIWYHVVGVADGSNVLIYVDGVLQTDQKTYNGTIISPNKNFNIGRQVEGGVYYWDGELSNISIFNTGLSSTDVQTLYNNGQPSDISSLSPIAWYKLNAADTFDGSDWTINDYGSGGNDGTSDGMDSSNLVVSDLQQTSGYSPYALDFDGADDYLNTGNHSIFQITGAMTVSYWFNGQGGSGTVGGFGKLGGSNNRGFCLGLNNNNNITFYIAPTINSLVAATYSHTADNNWHHLLGVFTPSTSLELYFDGVLVATTSTSVSSQYNGSNNLQIGARGDNLGTFNGKISNAAIWNTSLTFTEVTEIYNQGVPSNLNTFSGTAPISWWQLGSNSSYNSGLWTCLNEIGDKNFQSAGNMTNSDIVDGPGYSASGLGTSSIDIKGDAPYSSANGLSENMDVLDRTLDTPITNTHSIQLDGIDDYIDFGNVNIFERTDAFSGSCWINLASSASTGLFISKTKNSTIVGYQFYITASRDIILFIGDYYGNNYLLGRTVNTINASTWYNVAFTYSGSSTRSGIKIYINGVPQSLSYLGSTTITGSIVDSSVPFQISGRDGANLVLDGKIDEVAMFNSELSAPQVASIYNNGTPNNILPLNPVSWHRFESLTTNSGVVTTADSSGNGLTGTVENGAVLSTIVP